MEKKIVIVTGGFDPIHSGHLSYFEAAKQLGDELWVGVNSDAWLTRKKGRPFMTFAERSNLIKNLRMVDQVLPFDDDELGSSNRFIEQILQLTGSNTTIVVANGGDRNPSNIPEVIKYGTHPRVEFAWSVGGDDKKNSSSWILDTWKNQKTDRPWGYWKVLDDKGTVKVKELVINPGQSLSDQRHQFRSENWYILKGSCTIQTEWQGLPNTVTLHETDNYIIEKNVWHLTTNNSNEPCHVLEVQYGEKCVEDDIERR
jgi:cytidyltransferase-like protein